MMQLPQQHAASSGGTAPPGPPGLQQQLDLGGPPPPAARSGHAGSSNGTAPARGGSPDDTRSLQMPAVGMDLRGTLPQLLAPMQQHPHHQHPHQPMQQLFPAGSRLDAAAGAASFHDMAGRHVLAGVGVGAVPAPQPPYHKYYMQRVTSNVAHVLFYVVDANGLARLAVVGTDVKLSGHFVYASMADMADEAPPLRCTNRNQVLQWLAALGATELADDHEVTLPGLNTQQWHQLHSADPLWTRPPLDRDYTAAREETGTMPDGRHFKHYFLVNDQGDSKLMVVAEDGVRLDRRYTYKATDEVGGFCFENGKAVTDWLDYVLGKSDQPPSCMRKEAPERKKKLKKEQQHRGPDGQSPARSISTLPPLGPESLYDGPPGSPGPHWAPGHLMPEDDPVFMARGGSFAGPLPPGVGSRPHGGVPLHPTGMGWPADSAGPTFMGGLSGYHYQQQQQQHSQYAFDMQLRQQQQHQQQQMLPFQQAGHPGFGFSPGGGEGGLLPMQPEPAAVLDSEGMNAAVVAAGAEVRRVFSVSPDMLDWVTSMPDEPTVARFRAWAERLAMAVQGAGGSPAAAAALSAEARDILQMLCQTPASLRLLELSRICRPVAMLAHHGDPGMRDLATRLTQHWKRVAREAHDCASLALRAPQAAPAMMMV